MVDYTTAANVSALLQITISGSTTPTTTQVETFIEEAEDQIDNITHHAWRSVTVTEEYYDFPKNAQSYRNNVAGIPIFMRHRNITTFSSGTDKIEIWDGSSWVDWVATKTEGRDGDYWLDNEQGVLYIRQFFPYFITKAVRLTYRYGESSVPGDIQEATTKMAAMKVIQMDDQTSNLNETGDPTRLSYDQRISQWNKDIKRILQNNTEMFVV